MTAEAGTIEACGVLCDVQPDGSFRGRGVSGLEVRVRRAPDGVWHCVVGKHGHDLAVGCHAERDEAIEACAASMAWICDALRQMVGAHVAGTTVYGTKAAT